MMAAERPDTDVLVAGAGPTGLVLAAVLRAHGVRARVIDQQPGQAHESRALVVHPRTLELLATLGIADTLVERGRRALRGLLYAHDRVLAELQLGDTAATDTAYPFVVFISQVETEALLLQHVAGAGIAVERGVRLADLAPDPEGVVCTLEHAGGGAERLRAGYVVGCDGAHSAVRHLTGVPFQGDAYPQQFLLGDLEIDGPLTRDALHIYLGARGVLVVFPLRSPRSWRVLCSTGTDRGAGEHGSSPASLDELQAAVDAFSGQRLRLRDPVWMARFRFHHRQVTSYRAGRAFLAGDAAHIHSPAGGQGMNTGMQDAWNLAWKLALVVRGLAPEALLDSYQAERWPVGRFLLRFTDRLFRAGSSRSRLAAVLRTRVVPRLLPPLLAMASSRAGLFRTMSQLQISYAGSPVVEEGRPPLRAGPRAGDRLPDARVHLDGEETWLLSMLATRPGFQLLLCGAGAWNEPDVAAIGERYGACLRVHRLSSEDGAGRLVDRGGHALASLGISTSETGQYLVRPDGHVAFRCAGTDLTPLALYLNRWLRPDRR
jgi:2-polyprenyl-6-methoxyphenol hydroxylase-like FAD-dependent oxidoreductase